MRQEASFAGSRRRTDLERDKRSKRDGGGGDAWNQCGRASGRSGKWNAADSPPPQPQPARTWALSNHLPAAPAPRMMIRTPSPARDDDDSTPFGSSAAATTLSCSRSSHLRFGKRRHIFFAGLLRDALMSGEGRFVFTRRGGEGPLLHEERRSSERRVWRGRKRGGASSFFLKKLGQRPPIAQ